MEDLIDFPVSDTWLDYYHSKGLTPHHSGRQHDYIAQEIQSLRKEMSEIRLLLQLLLEELRARRQKHRSSQDISLVPETSSLLKEE